MAGGRGVARTNAELVLRPQYPYETLFRSQHYALLDNGCREFLFLCDFFMVAGNSALDLFNSIMGKTLGMFLVRDVTSRVLSRGPVEKVCKRDKNQ